MKTISTLLVLFLITTGLSAQTSSINLTFTSQIQGISTQFDSVLVHNMTQGHDTTLYWPDSVLTLFYSTIGISAVETEQTPSITAYRDPSTSSIMIRLVLNKDENSTLEVNSLLGTTIAIKKLEQGRGIYTLKFTPGRESVYLFCCRTKASVHCIKSINVNLQGRSNPSLEIVEFSPGQAQPKSSLLQYFTFALHDTLRYTGFKNGIDVVLGGRPLHDQTYLFHFYTDIPCPGLSSFVYGGQLYHTILIGNQCWMKENLNIGTMINSVLIQGVPHSECTNNGVIEKYCYLNNSTNCLTYGGLYDWDEMMMYTDIPASQGICPDGWHLPTVYEFDALSNYLGNLSNAGGKMKEAGLEHWLSPNTAATNSSGFTALPSGFRDPYGTFHSVFTDSYFWSSTPTSEIAAWQLKIYDIYGMLSETVENQFFGCSVRCVKY